MENVAPLPLIHALCPAHPGTIYASPGLSSSSSPLTSPLKHFFSPPTALLASEHLPASLMIGTLLLPVQLIRKAKELSVCLVGIRPSVFSPIMHVSLISYQLLKQSTYLPNTSTYRVNKRKNRQKKNPNTQKCITQELGFMEICTNIKVHDMQRSCRLIIATQFIPGPLLHVTAGS